jgi:hypothetical protein
MLGVVLVGAGLNSGPSLSRLIARLPWNRPALREAA